jgi:hypothetical protein
MSLSGTQPKKEPFSHKGSHKATISTLCSFLYILGVTRFLLAMKVRKVYKKPTFYTYAWPVNYSLYSRKYVIICSMIFLPYENKYQNKKLPLLTTRGSFLFSFLRDYFAFLYLRSYFWNSSLRQLIWASYSVSSYLLTFSYCYLFLLFGYVSGSPLLRLCGTFASG